MLENYQQVEGTVSDTQLIRVEKAKVQVHTNEASAVIDYKVIDDENFAFWRTIPKTQFLVVNINPVRITAQPTLFVVQKQDELAVSI